MEQPNLLHWITAITAIFTALTTLGLVFITRRYVLLTQEYVRLTQEILNATNKPKILVSLVPHEIFTDSIYLCIENIGTGFGSDIKLTSDPSFTPSRPGTKRLEEFGVFKQGIDYLGPGNKVQIFLFWTKEIPDLSTQSLTITVSHNDCEPEKDIKFLLDFTMWEGVGQQFKELEPIAEIEQTLKNDIAKSLKDIAQKL